MDSDTFCKTCNVNCRTAERYQSHIRSDLHRKIAATKGQGQTRAPETTQQDVPHIIAMDMARPKRGGGVGGGANRGGQNNINRGGQNNRGGGSGRFPGQQGFGGRGGGGAGLMGAGPRMGGPGGWGGIRPGMQMGAQGGRGGFMQGGNRGQGAGGQGRGGMQQGGQRQGQNKFLSNFVNSQGDMNDNEEKMDTTENASGKKQPICEVCELSLSGPESLGQHVKGSKHKKMMQKKGLVTEEKKVRPIRQQLGDLKLQRAIDAVISELVGLQYLVEYQHPTEMRDPFYECFLCDSCIDVRNVISHLTGFKHKHTYLKIHYADRLRWIDPTGTIATGQKTPEWKPYILKQTEIIAAAEGRMPISVYKWDGKPETKPDVFTGAVPTKRPASLNQNLPAAKRMALEGLQTNSAYYGSMRINESLALAEAQSLVRGKDVSHISDGPPDTPPVNPKKKSVTEAALQAAKAAATATTLSKTAEATAATKATATAGEASLLKLLNALKNYDIHSDKEAYLIRQIREALNCSLQAYYKKHPEKINPDQIKQSSSDAKIEEFYSSINQTPSSTSTTKTTLQSTSSSYQQQQQQQQPHQPQQQQQQQQQSYQWPNQNGNYSNTAAYSGGYGYGTTTSGYGATAGGYNTTAGGYDTTAGGYDTTAGGYGTTAGAYGATAAYGTQGTYNYGYGTDYYGQGMWH